MNLEDLKKAIAEDTLAGYMLRDTLKELLMYECLEGGESPECGCLSCTAEKLEGDLEGSGD